MIINIVVLEVAFLVLIISSQVSWSLDSEEILGKESSVIMIIIIIIIIMIIIIIIIIIINIIIIILMKIIVMIIRMTHKKYSAKRAR